MPSPFNIPHMGESNRTFHKTGEIPFYSCRPLEKIPGLHHGFSTRHGGKEYPPRQIFNLGHTKRDSAESIHANQRLYLSALKLQNTVCATLKQIHSCRIHIIKEVPAQWNPPEGDALITGVPGVSLGVKTADCFPVLIADPETGAIAAVHSGWRGTVQQIAFHTVRLMQRVFGVNPANLQVAIGAGIRPCCFEVGQEVSDLFAMKYAGKSPVSPAAERDGKFFVDLPGSIKLQLQEAGMQTKNICDLKLCTCCGTDEFFSYRAEGGSSGRMMAVIGRT